jgi:hypothetical protein
LNDLQQALSACEFLYECDETNTYSRIELRRFRCFETTLVVAYTRPFTQSRGGAAPLTMKMVDLKLSNKRQALHERLVEMRNKMMAHSDSEMMRMTTQPFDVSMQDGEPPMYLIQKVFDESVTLEQWFVEEAADGFNILPPYFPDAFDEFVQQVIPELQRRGLFRRSYS